MQDPSAYIDGPLIKTAWISTVLLIVLSIRARDQPIFINVIFACVIFGAFVLFTTWIGRSLSELPEILLFRVYNGTYRRNCILLFWLICILSSVLFCIIVNLIHDRASTTHRKFFHLTASLIAISGLWYEPQFVLLSAHLMLTIFVILELLRSLNVPPWSYYLNQWLLIFLDGQDSTQLILTPILLNIGIFLPIILSPVDTVTYSLKPYHFAGIVTVGVGDAFAAIIGSNIGKTSWPTSKRKTIEGSLAMFLSQMIFLAPFAYFDPNPPFMSVRIIISSLLTSIVEAHLTRGDNLVLPLLSYFIL